jgi:hypothetical protein
LAVNYIKYKTLAVNLYPLYHLFNNREKFKFEPLIFDNEKRKRSNESKKLENWKRFVYCTIHSCFLVIILVQLHLKRWSHQSTAKKIIYLPRDQKLQPQIGSYRIDCMHALNIDDAKYQIISKSIHWSVEFIARILSSRKG